MDLVEVFPHFRRPSCLFYIFFLKLQKVRIFKKLQNPVQNRIFPSLRAKFDKENGTSEVLEVDKITENRFLTILLLGDVISGWQE